MMANVTLSPAREPSAGGWGLGEVICVRAGKSVWVGRFMRPVLELGKTKQLLKHIKTVAAAGGQTLSF